jgi:hypothetical protein
MQAEDEDDKFPLIEGESEGERRKRIKAIKSGQVARALKDTACSLTRHFIQP